MSLRGEILYTRHEYTALHITRQLYDAMDDRDAFLRCLQLGGGSRTSERKNGQVVAGDVGIVRGVKPPQGGRDRSWVRWPWAAR